MDAEDFAPVIADMDAKVAANAAARAAAKANHGTGSDPGEALVADIAGYCSVLIDHLGKVSAAKRQLAIEKDEAFARLQKEKDEVIARLQKDKDEVIVRLQKENAELIRRMNAVSVEIHNPSISGCALPPMPLYDCE